MNSAPGAASMAAMPPALPAMRRGALMGHAAVYTAANLANSAIPFLLLPLLTRVLTPAEYGLAVVFAALVTLAGAFAGLSVHGAVNVRYFDGGVDHPRYVGTALALLGASTLATLVIALLASGVAAREFQMSRGWLLAVVAAAAANFVVQIRLVIWQARGQPVRYGLLQVGQTALNLGLSLLLVMRGFGWEGRAAGISLAMAACAALALLSLHRSRDVAWRFDPAYARDALRFGVPLMPHAIGGFLIGASDRILVAARLDVAEAGVYAAAMQIGLLVGVLADAGAKALSPWMYRQLALRDASADRQVVRLTYAFFAVVALVACLVAVAAPWMLLLVGSAFRANPEVVAFVALGSAFGGMYLVVVGHVFFARATARLAAASLFAGLFNFGLSWVLLGRHGAVGAAQAYAAAQLLLLLLTWGIAARCRPLPWRDALRRTARPPATT